MTRRPRSARQARRGGWLLALVLLVPSLGLLAPPAHIARAAEPAFVSVEGDHFTLGGQPVAIKGANYYQRDAPWAAMWDRWDGPQVEREIATAQRALGLNALRVLVPYGHGWADEATGEVNPADLDELRQLVQIAGAHGLRVIVTLFDFADDWPAAGTPAEAANLRYLAAIVGTFRDDDRVLAWDLHNEPDNYGHWRRDQRPDEVIDWLARMAAATRRLDPHHPLTVGLGRPEDNWLVAAPGLPHILDLIDFVSYHAYDGSDFVTPVRAIKARTTKPILLEEVGWPSGPAFANPSYSEAVQREVYQRLVDALAAEHLAGALPWLLFDLIPGRDLRAFDYVDFMGLIRPDDSLKPAGAVYAAWPAPSLPPAVTSALPLTGQPLAAADRPLYFPETGNFVAGEFKARWLAGDGYQLYGLPLTAPLTEDDHVVQFFERAVMAWYPERVDEPGFAQLPLDEQARRVVALWPLGQILTAGHAFPAAPPIAGDDQHWYFAVTGHSLSGGFLTYWLEHGGLAQFGYPLSEEFTETSHDGVARVVQYFERARFEYHPEAAGTPYEVQLGALGREELQRRGWLAP